MTGSTAFTLTGTERYCFGEEALRRGEAMLAITDAEAVNFLTLWLDGQSLDILIAQLAELRAAVAKAKPADAVMDQEER